MIRQLIIEALERINNWLYSLYEKAISHLPDEDLHQDKARLVTEYNQVNPLFRENKLRLLQITRNELEARKAEDGQEEQAND
jgi:hypothetical protein